MTSDSLSFRLERFSEIIDDRIDGVSKAITVTADTIDVKMLLVKQALQRQIDSLHSLGEPVALWQQRLDSLEDVVHLPRQKYEKLLALEREWEKEVTEKVPDLKSISTAGEVLNEKISSTNEVSTELGIGPLGEDLKQDIDISLPTIEVPGINANANLLKDLESPLDGLAKGEGMNTNIESISSKLESAGELAGQLNEFSSELKTIQQDGINRSEKLPELAEQQALQINEIQELQKQHNLTEEQAKKYHQLIEQYKEEKKILEEMEEKGKELANDAIAKNQAKVDESIRNISKYRRKFPEVHDMRELPKRAPNPMKDLGWRERLVPGFSFQTFSSTRQWLQFDPQFYYRLNGNLSAGVGGMYRLSINRDQIAFADFGSMYGGKVFSQYHAFKGFFIRAEAQYVSWKPWHVQNNDPHYSNKTWVAAAGIGRSYNLAKKIKGNAQTLYHWSWRGFDPYRPKIMVRLGFDFSLKKRDEKQWKKRLRGI